MGHSFFTCRPLLTKFAFSLYRTTILTQGGQEAQLENLNAAIAKHRPDTIVIQDFIHALEYLWKAAHCLHSHGTTDTEKWVMNHALDLLKSKVSNVAGGMRRSATSSEASPQTFDA